MRGGRFRRRWRQHAKPTLQRRLFWAFFGGVFLTAAAVIALSTLIDTGFKGSFESLGQWLAAQFVVRMADASALQTFTDETATALKAHIEIVDVSNQVIASSLGECRGSPVSVPLMREGQRLGKVILCWEAHGIQHRWLVYLGVGLLVLWGVAGRLARRLAAPLAELSRVVQRIGAGDLTARAQLGCHAPDEIGTVANAVNDMVTRLERQDAQQKELLAAVSHELRTPLARIRLISEIAKDGASATMHDELEREVAEIDNLVAQLLATSRLDFGQLAIRTLSARDVVERAVERSGIDAAVVHIVPSVQSVDADPTLLARALSNLIDNAVKHGKGMVRFEVTPHKGGVRFEVFDDGPGFPVEGENPFVAFSRSQAQARGNGLGLGLSLVKRIVEAHGGTVWAKNREGIGARVGFELPMHG